MQINFSVQTYSISQIRKFYIKSYSEFPNKARWTIPFDIAIMT